MADYKKKDGNVYQLNRKRYDDIPDRSRLNLRNLINPHPFRGIDYTVLILVLILVMFGLVMVLLFCPSAEMVYCRFGCNDNVYERKYRIFQKSFGYCIHIYHRNTGRRSGGWRCNKRLAEMA